MRRSVVALLVVLLSVVAISDGFAQGASTGTLSGTVVDSGGGLVPGATVSVKSNATGTAQETVTNSDGVFSLPALGAGTYSVTVTLQGFKTAVISAVQIAPGTTASLKAVLEIGALTETVVVASSSELINTQTPTVSSTLNSDQLLRMPTPTRNALNAVTFLPGVNTATTNRESRINGLPESFINITLDGVSNNDNFLRSTDSFFASVTPRQDAVEAVSVTTAAAGANVGGSGAVTINFATRSGTNRFSGSGYEYWRDPSLNSNYFFNKLNGLEKNDVKLNQYGFRAGGPIVMPGLFDGRNKAFFFVNYEQVRFPNSFTRTRVTLHPRSAEGFFRYTAGGQVREVNVLQVARDANAGHAFTIDPLVASILGKISAGTATTGVVRATSDPLLNNYVWQSPGELFEHQPTARLDYNINDQHRLSGSYQIIWANRDPDYLNGADARFPGAPNFRLFTSKRPLTSITLRSTLTSNLVNEIRGGITALGGSSSFGDLSSNGPQTYEDQAGFAINFPDFSDPALTNWFVENGPTWRSAPTFSLDNTLSWQKGTHSFTFGGSWLRATAWENGQQMVPGINLGFSNANDPAAGLFTQTNFPQASGGQLTDARDLYGMLTGRVIGVTGQAAIDANTNKYVAFGPRRREGRIDMFSGFMQDNWRLTPALTLSGGLRYDLQLPFIAVNDIMSTVTMDSVCGITGQGSGDTYNRCNFFAGTANGTAPQYIQYSRGTMGYDVDKNNFSPNIGVAWRPNVQGGWLRTLLGDPEQATLRAGYSVAYERQGMGVFTGVFGTNPGSTLSLTRDAGTGIVGPGEQWPVLLSQRERLYTASFPEDPTYPIAPRPNRADDMARLAPDIKVAYAGTWTVSFQRALSRDMAVDLRYVGTRGWSQWSALNYNDVRGENLLSNGFMNEFRNAMNNLTANNIAGGTRAGSFAYFGPGTGTTPLPIYLAYLAGRTDADAVAAYTTTTAWTTSGITQDMVRTNPSPINSANDLDGDQARRANALRAGLRPNFFIPNPDIDDVNITDSGAYSDYHALQVEVRRRLSKGLSANVNYQYAIEGGSAFDGFTFGRTMIPTANVRHAIKTQWDWSIPVGRGQRFGGNMNPFLDGILGGWSFNGVGRVQARTVDFGNVRLVGMTIDELTDMYKFDVRVNPDTGLRSVYMLPDDVILNTRRAFSVSTTSPTGYSDLGAPVGRYIAPDDSADCFEVHNGDCAPRTNIVRMPFFTRFDVGVQKRFPIKGSVNFELRLDVLNVFDNINFNPVTAASDDEDIFQATSAYTDPSNTYDPGGRLGQIMFRINW
jgi:hypothetical protein